MVAKRTKISAKARTTSADDDDDAAAATADNDDDDDAANADCIECSYGKQNTHEV